MSSLHFHALFDVKYIVSSCAWKVSVFLYYLFTFLWYISAKYISCPEEGPSMVPCATTKRGKGSKIFLTSIRFQRAMIHFLILIGIFHELSRQYASNEPLITLGIIVGIYHLFYQLHFHNLGPDFEVRSMRVTSFSLCVCSSHQIICKSCWRQNSFSWSRHTNANKTGSKIRIVLSWVST